MFKLILLAYQDSINLLAKKPQVLLLLVFIALVNIPLSSTMGRLDPNNSNRDLLQFLSQLIDWTLTVFLFWLAFHSDGVTTLSLFEWFKNNYLRTLFQYVGGFFLFAPFYMVLRVIFGDDGLAQQPGHTIVIFSISVWMFIAIKLGTLWLCFQNEGFLQNVKNAIKDVVRNFGYYFILQLLVLAFTYLSQVTQNDEPFTGLVCGLLVFALIWIYVSWMALVFGFLRLRKREQINLNLGGVQMEENNAS
jgi:hypothetical protein